MRGCRPAPAPRHSGGDTPVDPAVAGRRIDATRRRSCYSRRRTNGRTIIMRWARFEQNGTPTYGVVEGDQVIAVRGSPFDSWERTGTRLPFASVKLLPPVIPPTFYACGLNYADHVREAAAKLGQPPNLPPKPDVGYRANN